MEPPQENERIEIKNDAIDELGAESPIGKTTNQKAESIAEKTKLTQKTQAIPDPVPEGTSTTTAVGVPQASISTANKPGVKTLIITGIVIIALVIISIIVALSLYFSSLAKVPNVIGQSIDESRAAIESVSPNWVIEYSNENGEAISPDNLDAYYKYEIKGSTPSFDTSLKRDDPEKIILSIGKTDLQIQREQAISNAMGYFSKCGWEDVDCYEEQYLVIVKGNSKSSIMKKIKKGGTITPTKKAEGSISKWNDYAAQMNANLLICGNSSDKWLMFSYFAPYEQTPDEYKEDVLTHVDAVWQAGKLVAANNSKKYVKAFVSSNKKAGWKVEYSLAKDGFFINLIHPYYPSKYKYNFFENEDIGLINSPIKLQKQKENDRALVREMAWCLRIPVTLKYYNSDYDLMFTFKAKAPTSWYYDE